MPEWVCASCGARHATNDPPCRQCASEQFARLEDDAQNEDLEALDVGWVCVDCGARHVKNSPPCNTCGGMQFEPIYGETDPSGGATNDGTRTASADADKQSLVSSAGDVLFNKSLTRQLIDLELLLVTGFTWIGFLFSELIYHQWRLSNGLTTQYSHPGGMGEGLITKFAKVLFWIQIGLIGLGIVGVILSMAA